MACVEPSCVSELAEMVTAAVPGVVSCLCRPQCKGGAWVLSFQLGLQRVDVRYFQPEIGFVIDRHGMPSHRRHGLHRTVALACDATVAALTEATGPRGRSSAEIFAQIKAMGRLGVTQDRIAEHVGVALVDVRLTLAAARRGEI